MSTQDFLYAETRKEEVPCALCGAFKSVLISKKARDGVPLSTRMCKLCGLMYISPRMTKSEYDRYYKYFYRTDRVQEKRGEIPSEQESQATLQKNFNEAKQFGRGLAQTLGSHLRGGLALDVGSSTGGVLVGFKEVLPDLEIFGVEPSTQESAFAVLQGVPTENCLFEDFKEKPLVRKPNTIICVQSLNHLLNPSGFIEWAGDVLGEGGRLVLAVKNFRQQARRAGRMSLAVQIDHPYMFTPETLRALVLSRGFEIVYIDVDEHKRGFDIALNKKKGLSTQHIRLVARKVEECNPRTAISRARYALHRLQFLPPCIRVYNFFTYARYARFVREILGLT